jgi:geranylgeranylglycerol-phosphate geranylgeranyltransferase
MCAYPNPMRDQTETGKSERPKSRFLLCQLILFQSRKKWGIVYSLATVAGLFCVIGNGLVMSGFEMENILAPTSNAILLSAASFMIIIGMYVFNDLVDADIDRSNGKKRPIPAGDVTKKHACAFIITTNTVGVLLALMTFNLASPIIALMVVLVGFMYSAPKVALKDRFLFKTLSIAITMMLCAMLGSSACCYTSNADHIANMNSLIVPTHAILMLGAMIFVTSPVSDAADITGDALAGRRTIPIVIGRENTIKISILFATNMSIVSWLLYSFYTIGLLTAILVTIIVTVTIIDMVRNLKQLRERAFVLDPRKKTMPLHMMLQASLAIGALSFQTLHI